MREGEDTIWVTAGNLPQVYIFLYKFGRNDDNLESRIQGCPSQLYFIKTTDI